MRKSSVLLLAALVVATLVVPARAAPPIQLPALTRIASKLSGLRAREKVRVVLVERRAMDRRALALLDRDYPRDQQDYDETVYRLLGLLNASQPLRPTLVQLYARGVLGLYDPVNRVLYVRKGRDVRTALVHELVHALQDQTFDLRRLSSLRRGRRDAAYAASAAVEGQAGLATQVLGGRLLAFHAPAATRAPASHGGPRARAFLDIERQFPYTTGVRFMARLRNLGGNRAVFSALRRFPETTEQIFHLDAFLARDGAATISLPDAAAGFTRTRDDTFGELDVRALLAVYQVPRLDHVGTGWGGGRTALYRNAAGAQALALALDWDEGRDAAEWGEAVTTLVNEAFDPDQPGTPATVPCAADACWYVAGRAIAFRRAGARTALAIAPTIVAAAELAHTVVR